MRFLAGLVLVFCCEAIRADQPEIVVSKTETVVTSDGTVITITLDGVIKISGTINLTIKKDAKPGPVPVPPAPVDELKGALAKAFAEVQDDTKADKLKTLRDGWAKGLLVLEKGNTLGEFSLALKQEVPLGDLDLKPVREQIKANLKEVVGGNDPTILLDKNKLRAFISKLVEALDSILKEGK